MLEPASINAIYVSCFCASPLTGARRDDDNDNWPSPEAQASACCVRISSYFNVRCSLISSARGTESCRPQVPPCCRKEKDGDDHEDEEERKERKRKASLPSD